MTFFGRDPKHWSDSPTMTAAEKANEKICYLEGELHAATMLIGVLRAELKFRLDTTERQRRLAKETLTARDFDKGHRE